MQSDQKNERRIDGKDIEIQANWATPNLLEKTFDFVNRNIRHPWVIGVIAITAITFFNPKLDDWVHAVAIAAITVIVLAMEIIWKKRDSKRTD